MVRSGVVLTAGNVTGALLSLARNVIIARLISVEDFGIASTLAITMAMVEIIANIALDRLLVQARDGEDPVLLSTLHSFQAVLGLLGAAVLFVIAGPVSSLFGLPEVAWTYQAMAAIPFLRGLIHLDMYRLQRDMQFLPSVTVGTMAQLLATVAAFPAALWLGDYRAMLCVLLVQQLVFTVVSHLVAVRPYRWGRSRDVIERSLHFGWPVFLNGFLMFGVFHGDRIIVGTLVGITELGWFSVAFSLTFMPAMVLAATTYSFFLPLLGQAQDDPKAFQRLYLVAMQASLLLGVAQAFAFAILGPMLLIVLFGQKYAPAGSILVALAIMQGLRMARTGAALVATSKANTTNPLIANIARASAIPIAWGAASWGASIIALVGIAIAGEAVALLVSLLLLRQRLSLPLRNMSGPIITSVGSFALIGFDLYFDAPGAIAPPLDLMHVMAVFAALLAVWSMPELRSWSKALLLRT